MEHTLFEPSRELPVYGQYDVVVAGGGIAGIAAALSAARAQKHVLLLERMFALGGLATLGLVTIYLPLCDGRGKQLSYGISEELLKLSILHGCEDKHPDPWLLPPNKDSAKQREKIRYQAQYNAQVFAILTEQLLLDAGVEILYGTMICSALKNGDHIDGICIENKSGRQAVLGAEFVDCTGDADLCAFANAKTALYKPQNILAAWHYLSGENGYQLKQLGFAEEPPEMQTKKDEKPLVAKRFTGIDGKELSEMSTLAHKSILNDFLSGGKVMQKHALATIATIPQLRMTRRLCGEYTLDSAEDHVSFDDSIGMIGDWRKRGPAYEVPFRTLFSKETDNLLVAGRCISVADDMWDITRVIPACAITGQAAGTAAAIGTAKAAGNVSLLQKALREQGVLLHLDEIYK